MDIFLCQLLSWGGKVTASAIADAPGGAKMCIVAYAYYMKSRMFQFLGSTYRRMKKFAGNDS
jgi:hypothetical protein